MARSRLLLVDDDAAILDAVAPALRREGYEVETCVDGEQALDVVRAHPPDVVLLDVLLPGKDGFEVCRDIRGFSSVPIILLSAKSDTIDVVVGLESGADDYVTKPFAVRELVARVRALERRLHATAPLSTIRVGSLEIRPDEGIATRSGVALDLTKTEFRLLCALAAQPRRVFSREDLLREVWDYDYFGDGRLVDVHVRRLRRKVEDDPAQPALVQTVRGLGYRLVPPE